MYIYGITISDITAYKARVYYKINNEVYIINEYFDNAVIGSIVENKLKEINSTCWYPLNIFFKVL